MKMSENNAQTCFCRYLDRNVLYSAKTISRELIIHILTIKVKYMERQH
jgi:hypothetical protein